MTVPATTRRAGPFLGNGAATSFPFTFKCFAADELQVVLLSGGVESSLVLGSDYSVTLNADQDATPGGTVTYPITGSALALGETLTVAGLVEYSQELDLPAGGNFSPLSLENALDRTVMQVQQLAEENDRSLRLPLSAADVDAELPIPEANFLLGWNPTGTALANLNPSVLATLVAYGTAAADVFTGNGLQSTFALSAQPGVLANLDVSVGGVVQVPGIDYNLASNLLVFTSAPPLGVRVLARYMQGLPTGISDGAAGPYFPATSYGNDTLGKAVQTLENRVDTSLVDDFGCAGNGSTDDSTALLAAFSSGKALTGHGLTYKLNTPLVIPAGTPLRLRDALFDISGMSAASAARAISVSGSQDSLIYFTADTATGDVSAPLASVSGLSADQYVFLECDTVWSTTGGTVKVAFIAQIRSIDTGTKTVTFHEPLPYALATVSTVKPRLYPLNLLAGVYVENVRFIGQPMASIGESALGLGDGAVNRYDIGLYVDKCLSPHLINVSAQDVNYAGVIFSRCVGARRIAGAHQRARAFGLSYANAAINGCLDTVVLGVRAEDVRHINTVGGTDGINRKTIVHSCNGSALRDAGVDGHPATDWLSAVGNTLSYSAQLTGSGSLIGDGIISQGPNLVAEGNTIINPARHGVFNQLLARQGGVFVAKGNTVYMTHPAGAVGAAFNVTNQTDFAGAISAVSLSNNAVRGTGTFTALVYALNGNISNVTLDGNEAGAFTAVTEAVRVRAAADRTVSVVNLRGGAYKTSGTRCLRALVDPDPDGAGASVAGIVSDLVVSDVTTDGGTYDLSAVNVTRVSLAGITRVGAALPAYELTGSTQIIANGKLVGSATYDPPSLADGAGTSPNPTVTVTGATLGDLATATFSNNLNGVILTAWVSAADTVTCRFQNETGGTVDLASGTLRAFVEQKVV